MSMAVITSELPAWRHFSRVEERVGFWVRGEKEGDLREGERGEMVGSAGKGVKVL